MGRQLHVYFDGTWNDPSLATNVCKLFSQVPGAAVAVADEPGVRDHLVRQTDAVTAFYLVGVGADGDHKGVLEGALGLGLHRRVIDAFVLLSRHYQAGDKIWIFGFSRGAWSARALAGLVARAGLLNATDAADGQAQVHAEQLWQDTKNSRKPLAGDKFWAAQGDAHPISMVGVWDTVGALGIPFFNGLRSIDQVEKNIFDLADLTLNPRVALGRHAIALDERRFDFTPTLWNARDGVKQVWFTGAHADVGGGYEETGLSDIALRWMADEALAAGAALMPLPAAFHGDPRGPRHDESIKPAFKLRPVAARKVPSSADVHESVLTRLETEPGYRPEALKALAAFKNFFSMPASAKPEPLATNEAGKDWVRLDVPGASKAGIKVFTSKWWNATLLAVKQGERYRITADGQVFDADIACDANGYASGGNWKLKLLESSRRVPSEPWFKLMAAVHADKALEAHNPESSNLLTGSIESLTQGVGKYDDASQLVAVGAAGEVAVVNDGYLYLFVNDSAFAYSNNRQNLLATVTRLL